MEDKREPKDKKNPVHLIWGESKNIATDESATDDLLSWWVFVNDGDKRNRELTHSSFMPLGQRNLFYKDILDYASFLCADQDHRYGILSFSHTWPPNKQLFLMSPSMMIYINEDASVCHSATIPTHWLGKKSVLPFRAPETAEK